MISKGQVTAIKDPSLLATRNLNTSNVGQLSVLFHMDQQLLSGLHDEHIKRLGSSVAPGLRVNIRPIWGPNTESVLMVRCSVRDGEQAFVFAIHTIAMADLLGPASTESFQTKNAALANGMFAPGITSLKGVQSAVAKGEKHNTLFDGTEHNAPVSEFVEKAAESFVCTSVVV